MKKSDQIAFQNKIGLNNKIKVSKSKEEAANKSKIMIKHILKRNLVNAQNVDLLIMMEPLRVLHDYVRADAKKLSDFKDDLIKMNTSLTHVSLDRLEQSCYNIFGE